MDTFIDPTPFIGRWINVTPNFQLVESMDISGPSAAAGGKWTLKLYFGGNEETLLFMPNTGPFDTDLGYGPIRVTVTIVGNKLTYREATGNEYIRVFDGDEMTTTTGSGVTETYQREEEEAL